MLEEVAYHAWISENDFRETRYLFGRLRPEERSRYIRNAFVNDFHTTATNLSHWDLFIGQYKGNSPNDYSKIQNYLRTRLMAEILPDAYEPQLAREIAEYLMNASDDEGEQADSDEDAQYKRTRDGRLLASLAAARNASGALLQYSNFLLLSSSKALRKSERKFSSELGGEPKIVLTRGSFAYLLSMVPGIQLGADSLRRALFEFGAQVKLEDDERRALRIIRGSEAHDLHWAERELLQLQLNKAMQSEASRLGISRDTLKKKFITGSDPAISAELMANALRLMATDTMQEKEFQKAKNRIKELEEQLRIARTVPTIKARERT